MKKLTVFLIFLLFINCSPIEQTELKNNKTINESFTKSEIEDLQIILDFFNGQICSPKLNDYNSLNDCYNAYISKVRENRELKNALIIGVDFNKQILMYEKLNSENFNSIWYIGKSKKYSPIEYVKSLELNLSGNYINFLKKYGDENEKINEYYNGLLSTGAISPAITASFLKEYENYQINDLRTKLIIAIHFLTLNDNQNRNEKF